MKVTVKKGKPTTAKAIPLPTSLQGKGKPAARKKISVKTAVIAFALCSTLFIIWQWNRAPGTAPATPGGIPAGTSATVATAPGGESTAGRSATGTEGTGLTITAVRVTPTQPVMTDPITAIVSLAGGEAAGITFAYQWKRNEQFIPEATTNILKDIPLKRGDRISVVATAYRDGVAGPPAESQTVVVYGLPPTLEMKILTPQVLLGQPFEIQLTGTSPEGDKVVYALISPFVEGMSIDANTGKIIWTPARVLKGKLKFGAAATDTDGNRTMKVFELDMGLEQGQ